MHNLNTRHIKLDKSQRLYSCEIPIVGLTGGIASGKSTVSKRLSAKNFGIIDADKLIKEIYSLDETIDFINKHVPEAMQNKKIDFQVLREEFFNNNDLKTLIENFLYQKLPEQFDKTLKSLDFKLYDFFFYDVPLLFEKKIQTKCDLSVLTYCDPATQLERLTKRDQITAEQGQKILKAQLPIDSKRELSDFIIENTSDLTHLDQEIEKCINYLLS